MSVIDDVRDRLDIVDVVGSYVELKKAGRSFKACCPFHAEKTPSFIVNPDRGSWHCFGACGTGGDVFSFVMRAENTDFRGALELLARRAGVDLAPPSPQAEVQEQHKARLHEAMAAAAAFYHRLLLRSPEAEAARSYLKGRAFTADVARQFELGWAPAGWSALSDHLLAQGFGADELVAAGLARARDSGGVYDYFRGRLTIPIRDPRGKAIGFGARTLDPEGQPKYLNSPQTELFDKSQTLFALDKAGRTIRELGEAVVVEGYTDVIRAHAAACTNVVASLGTALTAQHVQALKRRAKRVVLALDADPAGQAATLRGLAMAQEALAGDEVRPVPTAEGLVRYVHQLDVDLRVATLPAGQDPDDQWRALIAAAQPVMSFLIEAVARDVDLTSPIGKSEAVDRLLPFLREIPDPVLRSAWVAEVARVVRVDERGIENRLATAKPARRPRRPVARPPAPAAGTPTASPAGATPSAPSAADGPPDAGPWPEEAEPPPADLDELPDAGRQPAPAPRPRRRVDAPAGVDLAGYVLGLLLDAPRRLRDLNAQLKADGQPALAPEDFAAAEDRDLLAAVRHASLGVPPPDAPPEERLDALPADHAARAEAARALVANEPPASEPARVDSLRTAVLRLREQSRRQALEALRFLQAEAAPDERTAHAGRVAALTAELGAVQRLLRRDLPR
jgi:DNA primase